ncbi:hypothetical protein EON65_34395 [archaeon]|nr:MAG: hypothetical protein EON65_34395 [archaeon]
MDEVSTFWFILSSNLLVCQEGALSGIPLRLAGAGRVLVEAIIDRFYDSRGSRHKLDTGIL